MTQYLHLLSNTSSPAPLDVWTPSGKFIQPQILDQIAIGYFKNYETALKRGVDHDLRKDIYDAIPNMTMADLKAFHQEYIQGGQYNIMVIGKKDGLNVDALAKYGPVKDLTLEEVFGY